MYHQASTHVHAYYYCACLVFVYCLTECRKLTILQCIYLVGFSIIVQCVCVCVCVCIGPTLYTLFLPRAHAQGGKVIGRVVVVVSTKIAISRDIGV